MVSMVLKRLFCKEADRITPTIYNASSGVAIAGVARFVSVPRSINRLICQCFTLRSPAQGAMLALLALKYVRSSH
jgi:hypothetical protein